MLLYWILLPIVWVLMHIVWRVRVVGRDLIPRGRPIVVAPNHLSELDPVFILVVIFRFRRFRILAKQELFRNPFVAWFLRCMGAVPIDRGHGDLETVNRVTEECKKGTGVLIFPEGTRSKDGKLGKLKSGAFVIAGQCPAASFMIPPTTGCICSAACASASGSPFRQRNCASPTRATRSRNCAPCAAA